MGMGMAFLCAALLGCGAGSDLPPLEGAGAVGVAGSEPLPIVRSELREFRQAVPWFGRTESRRTVTVVALEGGRIEAIEAKDGAEVRDGDPLFRLGGPAAERRRTILERRVEALEERVTAAGETVALQREALGERLVRRDELLTSEGELARLREELEVARQELDAMASALDLRASAPGVFTDRRVAVGQDVAAGDPLATIVDVGSLRVVASLFPPLGARLEDAPVTLDGVEGSGEARVVRVLPGRSATGATTVWLEGGPLDGAVPGAPSVGEAVSGTILLAHRAAAAVPEGAIARDERGRPFVFVPDGQGGYRARPVVTGLAADGWLEVTSGLEAGTEVVARGAYELLFRELSATYEVPD